MNKEEKINIIIHHLDQHIRGAGDVAGVAGKTKQFVEKYLLKHLNLSSTILDVGAGDCLTYEFLKDKIASWTGINKGVDQNVNQKKYGTVGMDFHNLEFANNSFDLVISVNTLEHAYFPVLMLYEMNRVAKDLLYLQLPIPSYFSQLPYDNHPDHYFVCSDLCWENLFSKLDLQIVEKGSWGGEYQWLLRKTTDWL